MSRVAVVGAGAAGLAAAKRLSDSGVTIRILDKGKGVGGRLATRSVAEARLDHGAQFFTARSPAFEALAGGWVDRGVAYEWCQGFTGRPDGHPRFAGRGGMTSLAKDLASGLDVSASCRVTSIRPHSEGWLLETTSGLFGPVDAVILNPPAPQTLELLAGMDVAPRAIDELSALRYEPAMAALVVLDDPASVPFPGGIKICDGPVSWVADNQTKGVSAVPAVTIHGRGAWSHSVWDRPAAEVLSVMLDAAKPYLGGAQWPGDLLQSATATRPCAAQPAEAGKQPLEAQRREAQPHGPATDEPGTPAPSSGTQLQLQRWRYATPVTSHEQRCLVLVDSSRPIVAAGDAFGEAKVEGAVLSGWAAADEILYRLL